MRIRRILHISSACLQAENKVFENGNDPEPGFTGDNKDHNISVSSPGFCIFIYKKTVPGRM